MRKFESTQGQYGTGQAGIPTGKPLPASLQESTMGMLTTGLVLKVIWPEDEDRHVASSNQRAILLDIRTTGTTPHYLSRVPLLGWQQLHDDEIIVPRETSQDITGDTLITDSSDTSKPTKAVAADGDWVLVGFLDNSLAKPVAFPLTLPHLGSTSKIAKSDGRLRRIRFNGTAITWDKSGNLTLDATGASLDALGAKGVQQSAAGTGGIVTLKTKDGAGAQSSIILDALGGVTVSDSDSCEISLIKTTKLAKITAGLKITLDAPAVDLGTGASSYLLKGTSVYAAFVAHFIAWDKAAQALENGKGTPAAVIAYAKAVQILVGVVQGTLATWLSTVTRTA